MRIRRLIVMVAVFTLLYVGYTQITAQDTSTCPGMIQQALETVGDNCGGLNRNSACYGYNSVMASFSQPQPEGYFTQPSDRAGLTDLEGITTSPIDQQLNQWGIALMSVQANLPDTLPGQSVVFMVMGGTQVENAVPPEDAFQTTGIVNVALQIGADLYFEPALSAQVVGNVPMGTALTADAVSEDGQWVRVVYQGTPGWVTRQVIGAEADLSTLSVIGANTRTPMQAFYFRTGIAGTECSEAPTSLIVQGPQNLTVEINANGADIQLGSTIALSALDVDPVTLGYLQELYGEVAGNTGKLLKIVVIDGHAVLNPGTPDEVVLETGETTFRCLSDPENLGQDGEANDREVIDACPWAPERAVTIEELEEFRDLEGFPLNYTIELPLELPTLTPTASSTPRPAGVVFVPTAVPSATPLPPETPFPTSQPPPPTEVPPPTLTPTLACPAFSFPAEIASEDIAGLIAAIHYANDEACFPGTNQINLASGGSYYFASVYTPPNLLPVITSSIAISGQGANLGTEISEDRRFFEVAASGSLSLSFMRLNGGSLGSGAGGAILNQGNLSLYNVSVTSNLAAQGGGLYNAGSANISRSTFEFNSAGAGAGIYLAGGALSLTNSTLSNNAASGDGGGLLVAGGVASLNFVTVYGNGGSPGGGLSAAGGSLTASNVLVAGSSGANCSGTISVSGTANFDDAGSCSPFPQRYYLNIQPFSAPNGGFTASHALQWGSEAIDMADCGGVSEDQRGVARPIDGIPQTPEVIACDSGSYEFDPSNPPPSPG